MSDLAELLSSRARAEIFRLLFGVSQRELHGREVARRSALSEASLRQELRKLQRLGLVIGRRAGNRVYYRADTDHPLYEDIYGLVIKTVGLAEVISAVLDSATVQLAFVFGSVVKGIPNATSDVDLMVVGDLSLRELARLLPSAADSIGREINPHVMTVEEYRARRRDGDHFVTHVLAGPKLFIVGSQRELDAMGE
jgi:DNA-binding transcriptional ArsR family regulator